MNRRTVAVIVACAALAYAGTLVQAQQAPTPKRTVLLQHDISIPGYEALLVAVDIPVGAREGRHTHPGTAMIHVTEGALTLDYEVKPTAIYKAGESFFVDAKAVHEGMNKGNVPVKAIATFIVPKGQAVTTQVGK